MIRKQRLIKDGDLISSAAIVIVASGSLALVWFVANAASPSIDPHVAPVGAGASLSSASASANANRALLQYTLDRYDALARNMSLRITTAEQALKALQQQVSPSGRSAAPASPSAHVEAPAVSGDTEPDSDGDDKAEDIDAGDENDEPEETRILSSASQMERCHAAAAWDGVANRSCIAVAKLATIIGTR